MYVRAPVGLDCRLGLTTYASRVESAVEDARDFLNNGGKRSDMWMQSFTPDMSKRGAIRCVTRAATSRQRVRVTITRA